MERIKMGKTEVYQQDLNQLFDELLTIGDADRLTEYLVSNSNLPGPRANYVSPHPSPLIASLLATDRHTIPRVLGPEFQDRGLLSRFET
jgi:hypothetical protein